MDDWQGSDSRLFSGEFPKEDFTRTMNDTPPDRLCADPDSPFHDAAAMERGVGIRFKGRERNDIEEYSVSEGWVRVALGKKVDRRGKPLTLTLKGDVEPYWRS